MEDMTTEDKHVEDVKTENMEPVIFRIKAEEPKEEDLSHLSGLSFGKDRASGPEIEEAVKWFAIGMLAGIFCFFFGRWVIRRFVGPGVLFFGYGAAYLGAPFSVIFALGSLLRIFRSARKKKVADAFEWVWMVSIMGDDMAGERFGKLAYAMSTMKRILPEGVGYDEVAFKKYVHGLRSAMVEAADKTADSFKKSGWHESSPNKKWTIVEDKELAPNLHEISALINFDDQVAMTYNNNKTTYKTSAQLELYITQYYIRSDQYWFPYDWMPAFQIENEGK